MLWNQSSQKSNKWQWSMPAKRVPHPGSPPSQCWDMATTWTSKHSEMTSALDSAGHCSCGHPFSVDHALSCPKGAMPSIRHNSIQDITAELLNEVCPNVGIEPTLQSLNGETFNHSTANTIYANTGDNASLDIKAQNFWDNSRLSTFFDVRVFNAHTPSNNSSSTDTCYGRHERKREETMSSE